MSPSQLGRVIVCGVGGVLSAIGIAALILSVQSQVQNGAGDVAIAVACIGLVLVAVGVLVED